MSEFKYACPVCGQHIKCDVSQAGTVMECPTCFQKITVPQAPGATEQKFILSGTKVGERPGPSHRLPESPVVEAPKKVSLTVIAALVLVVAAVAVLYVFKDRIFHQTQGSGVVPGVVNDVSNQARPEHGAIGLGSWDTQVEYTNVVVTKDKKVLFTSNFTAGTSGWRIGGGIWSAGGGVLRQTSSAMNCRVVAGDTEWSDYTLSVRARKLGGREGFLILFNVADDNNWTWWNLGGWGNTKHAVENCVSGNKSTLGNSVAGKIIAGQWYDLRVELHGPNIRCYLNNVLIQDVTYPVSQ